MTNNDLIVDEKANLVKLGKSQFTLDFLKAVTLEEAIENLTNQFVDENRVRNAWKRANRKK